jgi:cation diffusion facilitator CzcD-associated flavoprotein CzcO
MTSADPAKALAEPAGLAALDARVRRDLDVLNLPSDWVRPRPGPDGERVFDVVVVGGGQSGLGAAFALRLEGVRNVLVLDENEAGLEGPWVTYARMVTLRTPKHLTGINLGIPSLTFRAWWEAQHGEAGWAALDKIPRQDWMAYLRWYRAVLDLPVRNRTRAVSVGPQIEGLHALTVENLESGEVSILWARKVVFATGIQGGGEWHTPAFIRQGLSPDLYAHTSQAIDFSALKGRRIAILGGGASAFDNAQHALGEGVGEAHLFMRRSELPRVNPIRHMELSGLIRNFARLDDAAKYRVIDHFLRHSQPPTNDTFGRAAAYPGFALHLGSAWTGVRHTGQGIEVQTTRGLFLFDYLILSTGLLTDVTLRPELENVADDIALWRDRYRPPGQANPLLDAHPYLGPNFEFTGRTPGAEQRLHGLYAFNYAALASLGLSASALSGLKAALPRLATGIAGQLFLDDQRMLLDDFLSYDEEEFLGRWPEN